VINGRFRCHQRIECDGRRRRVDAQLVNRTRTFTYGAGSLLLPPGRVAGIGQYQSPRDRVVPCCGGVQFIDTG
jgi:hypothetical protein